jgi:hypothetical protein
MSGDVYYLRRGPSDPMPQSGMHHGSTNRHKLRRHIDGAVNQLLHARACSDPYDKVYAIRQAIKHATRALIRAKAET